MAEITKLFEYINEAVNFRPPINSKNSKICRVSTCPEFLPVKRSLMQHWGYSEAEVLNMPLKQAKWEHYGWLEHEGAVNFVTRADLDIITRALDPENVAWSKRMFAEARKN